MEVDEFAQFGSQKNSDGDNPAWTDLSKRMEKLTEEIDPQSAIQNVELP